jgi:hypothetical protein
MQTVDRVWFERGDWKDITEASLEASMKKQQEDSTDEKDEKKDTELASKDESQLAAAAPPGLDIMKLRESVINKLL